MEKNKKKEEICGCCHRLPAIGENSQGLAENYCFFCSSVYKKAEEQKGEEK